MRKTIRATCSGSASRPPSDIHRGGLRGWLTPQVRLSYLFALILLALSPSWAGDASAYRLATGDTIHIHVFGEKDLSVDATVNERGVISYPLLGELKVAGMTVQEVEDLITRRLKDGYLVNPRVNVTVKEYRPFFITGAVNSPGSYPYRPGLTLRQAVTLAGGFTERASKGRIYVIHEGGPDKPERMHLNDPVRPGDTITVKESFF
ncbi:MAG: polysaccharide export protein [Gammaproteobacteria bacterium]|nr:MAG: polysaccharide export protein [Gammaproteobacteria bacterium]